MVAHIGHLWLFLWLTVHKARITNLSDFKQRSFGTTTSAVQKFVVETGKARKYIPCKKQVRGGADNTVWSAVPYSRYRSKENQTTQHLGHLPVHVPSALLCSCVFCASAIWFCIVYQLATFWQGPVKPNYKNTRAGRSRHSVICYSLCDCTQCRDKEKQTTWRLCRLPVCVCCLLLSSALASLSFAWGTKPALRGWNVAQERPENLVNCVQYTYLHAAGIW